MFNMDAIDHPMMKEFHEPGDVKRSVIVIPHERLHEWLDLKTPDIQSFLCTRQISQNPYPIRVLPS